jgi:ribosome biogenesis GTPase
MRYSWSSAKTAKASRRLFAELRGRESLLTGASGVGKSTILNRLQPGLALRTGEVSEKNRRGKNTTVAGRAGAAARRADGWWDTPGFSDVGLWGIEPRELAAASPRCANLIDRCKFASTATHRDEPACAVREASRSRRGSTRNGTPAYLILLEELRSEPGTGISPADPLP